ncbi:MAG: hypothetical protein P1V81_06695 [Planctomycetota bacterium]|nr:hypothetical protein [Planctomycetota bacterium]
MANSPSLTLLLVSIACLGSLACAAPGERGLAVFGGRYTDASLPDELLAFERVTYADSWLVAASWSEPFSDFGWGRWEWELGAAKHFGLQTHGELNALVLARLGRPASARVPGLSLAIGEGLSLATEVPALEQASHTNDGARRLLNHLVIEVAMRPRADATWELFGRVHHRSGVFGLFDGVHGGSNVLALGVRWFL